MGKLSITYYRSNFCCYKSKHTLPLTARYILCILQVSERLGSAMPLNKCHCTILTNDSRDTWIGLRPMSGNLKCHTHIKDTSADSPNFTITTHRPRESTRILSHAGCFSVTRGIRSLSFRFIQIRPFAGCTITRGRARFSAGAANSEKHASHGTRTQSYIFTEPIVLQACR